MKMQSMTVSRNLREYSSAVPHVISPQPIGMKAQSYDYA